jgi:L-lactate dehydrogenase (cytochrome)/(S)-mandelate dehydrogenase
MALRRLPRFVSAYVETGAGDGGGVRRNVDAFRKHLLVPRGLVDVRGVDTGVDVFGQHYSSCFGISAVGTTGIYRRDADIMLAEAAAAANVPFILSGASTASVDAVVRAAPQHTWYQLYAAKDIKVTDRMIARAHDAGIKVLVFTVDYPIPLRSEVISRTGISLATGPTLSSFPKLFLDALRHPAWTAEYLSGGGLPKLESWTEFAPAGSTAGEVARYYSANWNSNQTWADVDRIRKQWPGALVIKGIVHPEDAARAIDAGADAVTVSNHGGNKLDCMQGCLDSLAAVRDAMEKKAQKTAGKKVTLFFDGGIRRGSDIIVAKALGADYCFLGRATLYGVTAGGLAGAKRALAILQTDLEYTMAMIGRRTVADITRACLAEPASPAPTTPHARQI